MKRYRATVDLYVNLDDETTEEDAKELVSQTIDHINANSDTNYVECSEVYEDEVYDTEEVK